MSISEMPEGPGEPVILPRDSRLYAETERVAYQMEPRRDYTISFHPIEDNSSMGGGIFIKKSAHRTEQTTGTFVPNSSQEK